MRRIIALALISLIAMESQEARAAGVYEDAVAEAGFLFARDVRGVSGRLIVTDGGATRGSLYSIAGLFPLHRRFVMGLEQSYIALSSQETLTGGFGDTRIRARILLFGGERRRLNLVSGLRVGNGSEGLFPYASRSFDFDLALGYVDTLSAVHVWAQGGWTFVSDTPPDLPIAQQHASFARMNGGVMIPLGSASGVRLGATYLAYDTGTSRQLLFFQLHYDPAEYFRVHFAGHFETGPDDQRVNDAAVTIGLSVYY